MDRAAILALIQAVGYGTDTQSVAAENAAIDAALLELSSERSWSWLTAEDTSLTLTIGNPALVVSGVARLIFPTHIRLLHPVDDIGYGELVRTTGADIKEQLSLTASVGATLPEFWAWEDRQIILWPPPDLAYLVELDFLRAPDPTAFDTGAEIPPFEARFHTLLAWGAIRFLAFRQRDWSARATAVTEYERLKLQFERADRPSRQDRVANWAGWDLVD